jgi:rare lipoprotein A (peptidoglycan hydrolase)
MYYVRAPLLYKFILWSGSRRVGTFITDELASWYGNNFHKGRKENIALLNSQST